MLHSSNVLEPQILALYYARYETQSHRAHVTRLEAGPATARRNGTEVPQQALLLPYQVHS
jgi:hypothetical protein